MNIQRVGSPSGEGLAEDGLAESCLKGFSRKYPININKTTSGAAVMYLSRLLFVGTFRAMAWSTWLTRKSSWEALNCNSLMLVLRWLASSTQHFELATQIGDIV